MIPRHDDGAAHAIHVERQADKAQVRAVGDIDLSAQTQLAAALRDALREPTPSFLVMDLRDVTYIDSTGVHAAIVVPRRTAETDGVAVSILASAVVRRICRQLGIEDFLDG